MDSQMSSSEPPPCVQFDSLKSELMKHIEAFEILSGLNSDLTPDILIKNLKKVLENVVSPKEINKKKNKKSSNASRSTFRDNETNKNPERNSSTPSVSTATTNTKTIVPSSRKGRQNKEKLNVEKEQVGRVIDDSRKATSSNKIKNELYWGDFEKRRSVRRKSSASTSKYDNYEEGETEDSYMDDQEEIFQNNIMEQEDVKVDMNTSINNPNLTNLDESLDSNKDGDSIEKKLVAAEEGTRTVVYECTICNKQLTYEWNARRHVKQVHFKERFFCPNANLGCQSAFYNQTRLRLHLPNCKARQRSKKKNKSIPIPSLNLVLNNPFKNFKLKRALNARVLVTPLIFANNKSPASNVENQEFPPLPTLTKQSTNCESQSTTLIKRDNNSPPPVLIPLDFSPAVVTFDFVRQDVFRSPPSKKSIHDAQSTSADLKFKAIVSEHEIIDENEDDDEQIDNDDDEYDKNQTEENENELNKTNEKHDGGEAIHENPNFVPTNDNGNDSTEDVEKEPVGESDSSFNEDDDDNVEDNDDEDMENNSMEDSAADPVTLNCDLEIDAIEKPQPVKSSQNKLVVQSSVPLTQCQDTSNL